MFICKDFKNLQADILSARLTIFILFYDAYRKIHYRGGYQKRAKIGARVTLRTMSARRGGLISI